MVKIATVTILCNGLPSFPKLVAQSFDSISQSFDVSYCELTFLRPLRILLRKKW
jgi:hypothetical protein